MNERDHAEMEMLKRRQEALQRQLATLTVDIENLSSRLNAESLPVPQIHPLEVPPLEAAEPSSAKATGVPDKPVRAAVPPPLPPIIPIVTAAIPSIEKQVAAPGSAMSGQSETAPASEFATEKGGAFERKPQIDQDAPSKSASVPPPIPQPSIATSSPGPVSRPRETFEMKLGTYWLVRVGIVMLLTGLVFLGTYAYKNFIVEFGAPGKVALLYTASATLLGLGAWLQRKQEKESLRNYGQVLFAGGLAAVYFTTYAAHHLVTLRVIASPLVDGILLMAWAAFTVWIADRRKSEVLALFAVGLAYYTSGSAHVDLAYSSPSDYMGLFTLGSNLLLTATAVFFLVRNRWTTLSFISVLATYGGFVFWRFYNGDWSWNARTTGLWHGNFFLAGYWLFFTAAVFLARGKSLTNVSRALFASLNNAAFFALVLLSMMHVAHGNFWKFSLGFGTTLLGAAWLARKFLPEEAAVKNSYLVQGLTLITLGFIAYFTGLHTALVLAAESVVLTFLGRQQKNYFVRAGGYLTAALSAGWACATMTAVNIDVAIGTAVAAAFLLNAWWENRNDEKRAIGLARPSSGYFIALMLAVCAVVTWHAVPDSSRPVAWMIEAVAFATLFYALRISALPTLSQTLSLAALAYWCFQFVFQQHPHWNAPVTLISGTLALIVLGHRQKNPVVRASGYLAAGVSTLWLLTSMSNSRAELTIGAVISAAFLLGAWWEHINDEQRASEIVRPSRSYFVVLGVAACGIVTWHAVPEHWRPVAWMIEALLLTTLFYAVRIPEIPLFSQALALLAQGFWFFEFALRQSRPHWIVPATLVAGSLALSHWWQRQKRLQLLPDLRNALQLFYGLALVGVLFFWSKPDAAAAAWLVYLSLLAIGLTIYGVATRAWILAACAQLFLLISSVEMYQQFLSEKPKGPYALVIIASWLLLGIGTTVWLSRHDTREQVRQPLLRISVFYRAVAFLMSLWWIYTYVAVANQFAVLCVLGVVLLALAGWRRNREALVLSGAFFAVAFAAWFIKDFRNREVVNWLNGVSLLSVVAAQQIVRRFATRFELPRRLDAAIIVIIGVTLWTFVSRWVVIKSGTHFLLTVSWALLAAALFTMGFAFRERMYRWLGLALLACAVGRVFLSDVWKLETIYRILSFMALGVVLLALGFIYNKYQEKIRQWL